MQAAPAAEHAAPAAAEAPAAEAAVEKVEQEAEKREPVPDSGAADNGALGANAFVGLSFAAFVLFVIGTPIPWYKQRSLVNEVTVSLWTTWSSTTTTAPAVVEWACKREMVRFRAMEAFALITIGFSVFALVAGVLARASNDLKRAHLVSTLTGVVSLVAWAMGVANYHTELCATSDSYATQKYEIGVGLALFITGWVLTVLAAIVSKHEVKIPPMPWLFTFASFVGIVFTVVGTAVPWAYVWNDITAPGALVRDHLTTISLWKIFMYDFTTTPMTASTTTFVEIGAAGNCPTLTHYTAFAQSFSIISISACFFAWIAGLLAIRGKLGNRGLLFAAFFVFLSALLTTGAFLSVYYRQLCATMASLNTNGFALSAGCALFTAVFVGFGALTLRLVSDSLAEHLAAGATGGKWSSFLFIVSAVASVILLCISANQNVVRQTTDDFNYQRWTWWKTYTLSGGTYTEADFTCAQIWSRLVGGGALVIISIALSGLSGYLGVLQLGNAAMRIPASVVGFVSSITQLVAWGLAVSVAKGTFCGADLSAANFKLAVAVGITIVSWGLTLVTSIINIAIA